MSKSVSLALVVMLMAGTAHASSDDSWEAFAKDVEQKCLAAAKGSIDAPRAIVDPFGSERFGLAVVTGKAKGAKVRVSHICVMDKRTKAVELGSELGADKMKVDIGQ